jgi:hypothetical protein
MATSWSTLPAPKAPKKSLGEIPDYFGTGGPAGSAVARLARIPGADPAIYQQFMDAEALRENIGQSTGNYFSQLAAKQPRYDAATESDLSEIDAIMNPSGYQQAFQGVRDRRRAALSNLDRVLLGDMRRGLSQGQIGSGGGGGMNSYLARIAAGEAAKIRAQAEADHSTAERTDLSALMAARQGVSGKRGSIIDTLLSRLLQPVDIEAKANSIYSDTLGRALQQALLNSISGVANPT